MLIEANGTIQETTATHTSGLMTNGTAYQCWDNGLYHWHGYPVYVTQDKTAKAIAIFQALEAEKLLECKSVPKFIALVEKIAALL